MNEYAESDPCFLLFFFVTLETLVGVLPAYKVFSFQKSINNEWERAAGACFLKAVYVAEKKILFFKALYQCNFLISTKLNSY